MITWIIERWQYKSEEQAESSGENSTRMKTASVCLHLVGLEDSSESRESPEWNGTVWEPRLQVISIVIRDSLTWEKLEYISCVHQAKYKNTSKKEREMYGNGDREEWMAPSLLNRLVHTPYHFTFRISVFSSLHLLHMHIHISSIFSFFSPEDNDNPFTLCRL